MRLWPQGHLGGYFRRGHLMAIAGELGVSAEVRTIDTGTTSVGKMKVLQGPVYDLWLLMEEYERRGGDLGAVKLLYDEGFEMEYWRAAEAELEAGDKRRR